MTCSPSKARPQPDAVYRSRDYLVQLYHGTDVTRITINATTVQRNTMEWGDNIPWPELQRIKREVGYGDRDAVEIFPADRDVVNVANMRHLWVMSKPIEFAWRWKPK